MHLHTSARDVEQSARGTTANRAVIALARLGYTVKGIIYVVIGFLAVLLVTGHGGSTTDQNGALRAIYDSPLGEGFGRILLIIITVGLFGFALWSLIQAVFDTEHKGHKAKGIVARLGYAGVAVSYGLLGVGAYQLAITGAPSSRNSTSSAQNWTGLLLKQPAGVWLVVLVGCIVLGIAAYLFVRAYQASFKRYLNLSSLSTTTRKSVILLGRLGNAALGVVFTIVGIFLIVAAVKHNPGDAKGLNTALTELLRQPFGEWLLGVVALGLLAYGVYSFVEARYRRVGGL
ncbi:MAG TPA: DUF1206 domain-containing protein [Ktedonobacteraceae bacterium]|jgi:hypothetical protein|nr:DUF1206 domain-containing protein [Ktedonobacteraceae bacterium]